MEIRKAIMKDIPTLVELRKQQLIAEGLTPIDIDKELHQYFNDNFTNDSLVSWICEDDHKIIATSAIWFYQRPPSFTNASGTVGYVTNMYTLKEYRRQGIAIKLLDKLIIEAKERNCKVITLEASSDGQPVYEKYGFNELSTMAMILKL